MLLGKVLYFFEHQFSHLSVDIPPVWKGCNQMPHNPGYTIDIQQMVTVMFCIRNLLHFCVIFQSNDEHFGVAVF